jgi:hypothetical protein
MIDIATICSIIALNFTLAPGGEGVCADVLAAAEARALDPWLTAALVYHESRFDAHAMNDAGTCVGPFQINVEYHCTPNAPKECDLITTGAQTLAWFIERFPHPVDTVCHYNTGPNRECGRQALIFADTVLDTAAHFEELATEGSE